MRVVVEVTVDCSITDEFALLEMARAEVDAAKATEDRASYYPDGPTQAVQQLIRTAIASRLQSCGAVSLHEIGHGVKQVDMPL